MKIKTAQWINHYRDEAFRSEMDLGEKVGVVQLDYPFRVHTTEDVLDRTDTGTLLALGDNTDW